MVRTSYHIPYLPREVASLARNRALTTSSLTITNLEKLPKGSSLRMQSARDGGNGTIPAASRAFDSMPVKTPIEGEDVASAINNNNEAAAAPHPVRAEVNGFRSTVEVDGLISSIEFFLDFSYGEYGSARKGCQLSLCICSTDFAERS